VPTDVTDPSEGTTKYLAEGQAGFWLMECLLLALVESGVVEKDRLLEIVDSVIEAKRATAAQSADPSVPQATVALLSSLANSLQAAENPPNGGPDTGAGNRRASPLRRRSG
jgi:hypothetical protein